MAIITLNSLILSLLFIMHFIILSNAQPSFNYLVNCTGSPTYAENSAYQSNLHSLLSGLPSQASNSGFYSSSSGQDPDRAYALYLCRADLDSYICNECVYQAQAHIFQNCSNTVWGVIWYDECMIRFNNTPVWKTMSVSPYTMAPNPQKNDTRAFAEVVNDTMVGLVNAVGNSSIKFGTKEANVPGSVQKIYGLEQCTPDLNEEQCQTCLTTAITQLPRNCLGARVVTPSCYVRFETTPHPWYGNGNATFLLADLTNGTNPGKKKHIVVAVTVSIVLVVSLLCSMCFYFRCRKTQQSASPVTVELHDKISTAESLQFDFRTIRVATDNFSIDNKLGEGGFGSVYKGRLSNGQDIAVKRLSTNSKQGIGEFKTEVGVVARLQHKNLVQLLGYCLQKNEKLLVYEFLPNSSLDKVLLDRSKDTSLDWETRYKIITGIAKGLLYLHEDSRLKIIHRDMKSGNILLDESMNPKIADFGLAKHFGVDQTQADTSRILGTYGYMAPEYTRTGRFSIKSDVYSFGVIVLEIISGHKCNSTAFPFHEESLIDQAWRLWNEDNALELVDIRLESNFSVNDVAKCIHIGLLCIQNDANKRPTMAPIVAALNGHPVDLPAPVTPQPGSAGHANCSQYSSTISSNKDIITELNDPR